MQRPTPHKTRFFVLQVLECLPVDTAVQVLRGAPGTFLRNFVHLPHALKPVAALAEYPALAATCMLPVDGLDTDPNLPFVALCVDTSRGDVAKPQSMNAPNGCSDYPGRTQDIGMAAIWLHEVKRTPDCWDSNLFSLEHRADSVVCRLGVRTRTMQDVTIELPDNACIVFGQGSMHLKNVTFHGTPRSRCNSIRQ